MARRSWLRWAALPALVICIAFTGSVVAATQPVMEQGVAVFTWSGSDAQRVTLAGTFNGWDPTATPLTQDEEGVWRVSLPLSVGFHEYKFVVDGAWLPDPSHETTVTNNYGEPNSILYVNALGEIELRADRDQGQALSLPAGDGTVYLALIWHQHQPYYYDAERDALIAPWVRTHITKDYYDMTAMLTEHPDIHVTMNLTPVLLTQIEDIYVKRIAPHLDRKKNRIRTKSFLKKWKGKTDPWIDLMLKETGSFGEYEEGYLFRDEWSAFSVSRVIMARWPEYQALRDKPREAFTVEEKRDLKCFFYLANFDPRFLRGPVTLVTGEVVDLSDIVQESAGPIWTIGRHFTEDDANRLVAETIKIAEAIIPLHRQMRYDTSTHTGQVEVTTTPYYHPILPLIADLHSGHSGSDSAPDSILFSYPSDAAWQVELAVKAYQNWFGEQAYGFWPAEGSVSQQVLDYFAEQNLTWIATGDGVLWRSTPTGLHADRPYVAAGPRGGEVAIFFRDTELSDLIGFSYQRSDPHTAAEDLVNRILAKAPKEKDDSILLTVLLDGENAWEWYEQDPDAIEFLHAVYRKLEQMQEAGQIITVTPAEYLAGNPERGIPSHHVDSLDRIDSLWPGSWIRADFATWVGEDEENRAWYWLSRVREDVERLIGSEDRDLYLGVWRSMGAAEGSDWFWWYGDDQNTGEGDLRWDLLFRAHLRQVYAELRMAGFEIETPDIPSLMDGPSAAEGHGGAMTPGQ